MSRHCCNCFLVLTHSEIQYVAEKHSLGSGCLIPYRSECWNAGPSKSHSTGLVDSTAGDLTSRRVKADVKGSLAVLLWMFEYKHY